VWYTENVKKTFAPEFSILLWVYRISNFAKLDEHGSSVVLFCDSAGGFVFLWTGKFCKLNCLQKQDALSLFNKTRLTIFTLFIFAICSYILKIMKIKCSRKFPRFTIQVFIAIGTLWFHVAHLWSSNFANFGINVCIILSHFSTLPKPYSQVNVTHFDKNFIWILLHKPQDCLPMLQTMELLSDFLVPVTLLYTTCRMSENH
jgi:hypothetical protein